MQLHATRSHGATEYPLMHECTYCNKKYFNQTEFTKHIQRHTKKEETEQKKEEANRKKKSRKINQEKNTDMIRQFFSMTCTLCPTEFTSFLHVKQHYRIVHKQPGFLECCKKKYTRLHKVLDHCSRHLNPQKIS